MALTKAKDRMIDNGVYNVMDFGADATGATDSSVAFQAAADKAVNGEKVIVPAGTYLIETEVQLPDNYDWEFLKGSVIKNGLTGTSGLSDACFAADGSAATLSATINGTFERNSDSVITLSAVGEVAVGDMLAFESNGTEQFSAVVLSISSNDLTMDRVPSCDLTNGGAVLKVTPKSGRFVGATFDFNGTTASPRYGYGFYSFYNRNSYVRDITGTNIGSKCVQFNRSMDCTIDTVRVTNATDVTGGNGYAVRIGNSNDCVVKNVYGANIRHVVDLTASSRNRIENCVGHENEAIDFLTHFNNCIGNVFYECESYSNDVAAFSFTAAQGDEDNQVLGGKIVSSPVNRPNTFSTALGNNRFIGTYIENSDASPNSYIVIASGWFQNCEFVFNGGNCFSDGLDAIKIIMTGGSITNGSANQSMGNLDGSSTSTSLEFSNVVFNMLNNYRTFVSSNAKKSIIFRDCFFRHVDTTATTSSTICYGDWASEFYSCSSSGTSYRAGYSLNTGNTLKALDCSMPSLTGGWVSRDTGANAITLTIDRRSLQDATTGNPVASPTIQEPRSAFVSATTLGTVNGKVAVYNESGALQGYFPVYDGIS